MTKVEAIKKVLEEFGGVATWEEIYNNIEKYYPSARASLKWKEGIRGVLYREIKNGRNFKRVGLGIYALKDYEEEKPNLKKKKKMHAYIEGICLEIGKFLGFDTYTPDKTSLFKDNIYLGQLATISEIPQFTYKEIIDVIKRIDVLWFNKEDLKFPLKAFEIVDAIGTLTHALNRCIQLFYFNTDFIIVGPNEYKDNFNKQIKSEPYIRFKNRFAYKDYNTMIEFYDYSVKMNKVRRGFFGRI